MDYLDFYRKNFITIEVFITRKCPFYCEHCMYDCGPKESSDYISDDMLMKVKKQVDFLHNIGVDNIAINLTGGEPTINLNKFKHILDLVETWDVSVMLTTNSWWANSKKNTEKFFEIVSPYAHVSGRSDFDFGKKGFVIRLTNDPFHDKYRGKPIAEVYNDIWENFDMLVKYQIPLPSRIGQAWIFYYDYDDRYYIAPNGRGKDVTNLEKRLSKLPKGYKSLCMRDLDQIPSVHYEMNGNISDTCGFGSLYEFGSVEDNILFIFAIIQAYKFQRYCNQNDRPYTCYDCRESVEKWKDENLEFFRDRLSYLNIFDDELFVERFEQTNWEKTLYPLKDKREDL
jgi:organic radical activating enzyme